MYSIANVERFLLDNKILIGKRSNQIMERAIQNSDGGMISGENLEEIMQDKALAIKFAYDAMYNQEHIKIIFAFLKTA